MTKQTYISKPHSKSASKGLLIGARITPVCHGAHFMLMEDFLRTIRSFCARVVSPPMDFLEVARRTRWRLDPLQTITEIQETRTGNKKMKTKSEATFGTNATKQNTFHSGGKTMDYSNTTIFRSLAKNKLTSSFIALTLALGTVTPAWATIDNTVTVTGSSPSGTGDVTDDATENVDVENAAPSLLVTKVADDVTDVPVGQLVTYTYTATNNGNQTLTDVSMADSAHEGSGAVSTVTLTGTPLTDNGTLLDSTDDGLDEVWDTLAPLDTITWTATYTVTQADLDSDGGDGDGELTNTGTATGTSPAGPAGDVTDAVDESIDLEDQNPSLLVAKLADDTTNVVLGQLITYTYTITNNGNVPITDISLGDVHNGSGPAPTPNADGATLTDNGTLLDSSDLPLLNGQWDTLAPLDVLTLTATYTVTQSDIDNLQ